MGNRLNFHHGGNIYEIKRKYNKEVIDFSANINPIGIPPEVKNIVYKGFDKVGHYPDPYGENVLKGIASYWRIKKENILLGNGSVELIYLIMQTFKPHSVCIPVPSFSEYERAAKCINSKIRFVYLDEKETFCLNPSFMPNTGLLFIGHPNNPTGNCIVQDKNIFNKMSSKLVVVDEAFMDFLPDEEKNTLIWNAQRFRKFIVIRTFTKFFALPGLRIGYVVAHKDTIRALKQYQIPWTVNVFAQEAAGVILGNKTYINKTRLFVESERQFLFNGITKIKGLKAYPSVTNFLLSRIENKGLTSSVLTEKLIKKGILIRDCANFRGMDNSFIRIAMRSRKENLLLLKAIREVL